MEDLHIDDLQLNFAISKIDHSRRVVTGIATADNIDPSGDIIDFEASKEAFANWAGNVREMHKPIAAGRSLSYREVKVPYQGHEYDGIEVDAYISKGAEDTWEKVLDGTLRGFSVGGKTIEKAVGSDKYTGRRGQRIKKYELGELSLVDNPGNPASLISLVKRAPDGSLEYDLLKYNVYYCSDHQIAQVNDDKCPSTQHVMKLVGSVEDNSVDIITKTVIDHEIGHFIVNQEDKVSDLHNKEETDIVKNMNTPTEEEVIDGFFTKMKNFMLGKDLEKAEVKETAAPVEINIYTSDIEKAAKTNAKAKADAEDAKDGGADDDEENADGSKKKADAEDATDNGSDEQDENADGSKKKAVKKSAETDGGQEEMDLDILKAAFGEMLDEKLTAVKDEISASVDEKIEKIQTSVDEVATKTEETSEKVEKVENSGALKKSVDANEETEEEDELEKRAEPTFWNGSFVPMPVVQQLGYDS